MMETTLGLLEQDKNYINIDFSQIASPKLVTKVLETHNLPEAKVWELTVGQRIIHLLHLVSEGGKQEISVHLTCLNTDCNESLELAFTLEEFLEIHNKAKEQAQLDIVLNEKEISLRRPTGFDQQNWQKLFFENKDVTKSTLIRTLLIKPKEFDFSSLVPEELKYIDETMQAFDPLLHFSFETGCPECDESFSYELDLQELALQRLKQTQAKFLEDIHKLALNYHWSESQILALPQWRRRSYLDLLNSEVAYS